VTGIEAAYYVDFYDAHDGWGTWGFWPERLFDSIDEARACRDQLNAEACRRQQVSRRALGGHRPNGVLRSRVREAMVMPALGVPVWELLS